MLTEDGRRVRRPPLPPELAAQLEDARVAAGLSIRAAAGLVGVVPASIRGYETRRWTPSVAVVERMADVRLIGPELRDRLLEHAAPDAGYSYGGGSPWRR